MPNYLHTVIYKIEHKENKELVYVGSTTNFTRRKGEHKSSLKNEKDTNHNYKLYVIIRENGDWNSFEMLEIKKFPCNNKREAEAEEERCRVELKATMNMRRAIALTQHEYWEANKEKLNNKNKKYREEHKQEINKKRSEKFICECGTICSLRHKARHFNSKKHNDSIDV